MSREIKFRIWDSLKKEMLFEGFHVFGEVTLFNAIGTHAYETRGEKTSLDRYNDFEITQYTGLKDRAGKEIFEGDILKYFTLKRYTQQSHADVPPEIDELYLQSKESTVIFKDGAFQLDNETDDYFIMPISECGLSDLADIKDNCGCVDDETCDINGVEINAEVLGIEVIGNIYSNP